MASLIEELQKYLTPETVQQLSQQVDAPQDNTEQAINALVPMMLGGLSRNVDNGGAAGLNSALERDHDGSILDQLSGLIGGGGSMSNVVGAGNTQNRALNSAGILGHLFGSQTPQVERGVSQASSLNTGQVATLASILAPMVMGALGKVKRQDNLDQQQVADLITRERQQIERDVPATQQGGLSSLLDSNKDGKINLSDDIAKVGMALGAALIFGKKKR